MRAVLVFALAILCWPLVVVFPAQGEPFIGNGPPIHETALRNAIVVHSWGNLIGVCEGAPCNELPKAPTHAQKASVLCEDGNEVLFIGQLGAGQKYTYPQSGVTFHGLRCRTQGTLTEPIYIEWMGP